MYLHSIIDRHVAHSADKTAFRFSGRDLSFHDLDHNSAQLARALQNHGLQSGERVGLFLHRGLEAPTALFATSKAGGAFVPLDPFAPLDRLAHIVTATQMRFVITHSVLAGKVAQLAQMLDTPLTVIGLDTPISGLQTVSWAEVADIKDAPMPIQRHETDLAYILFTSGSTGAPKGIMHTHRSSLAFVENCTRAFGFNAADRMAALSPLIFDMSLNEYLGGPYVGATVVIVPDGNVRFPASLGQLLQDEKITCYCSVPSLLIRFLEAGAPERFDLSSIRWMLTGGEPIAPKHLTAGFKVMPNAHYGNCFGPTETNSCAFHIIEQGHETCHATVPIGTMGADATALIVNEALTPVPQGESGELLVLSACLMSGYWQDEARSKAAFHHHNGDTYLRTGDHVRAGDDGVLHYLGRMDNQVKTRGYRVELGEVEAALTANEDVIEAAAFLYTAPTGDALIGAAVTLSESSAQTATDLTRSIKKQLPPYAVPQIIQIIATFPRTQSGKISRRDLSVAFESEESLTHA